jgi:hypothetical protein
VRGRYNLVNGMVDFRLAELRDSTWERISLINGGIAAKKARMPNKNRDRNAAAL